MSSISDPNTRKCKGCSKKLPITAFATKPNGDYYVLCEVCREKQRAYYQENKEQILEKQRLYHEEHREERLETMKKYGAEHKAEKAEYDRQYREEHKEDIAAYKKNWREERLEEARAISRQYYADHREEQKAYSRQYYYDHKEEKLEYFRKYYEEHKEQIIAYNREYWSKRLEIKAVYTAARRAKKKGAAGKYMINDLVVLYALQAGCCCWCGKEMVNRLVFKGADRKVVFTVDHIRALTREGSNYAHNLVLACPSCNYSKHNKEIFTEWQPPNMLEWMREYINHALKIENERNLHDTNETHT